MLKRLLHPFVVLCIPLSVFSARIEPLEVVSHSMRKSIPATVILPDSYAKDSCRRYPVVYLLHGADGHSRYYVTPTTCSLVDKHQVIAVCADGNKRSWWIDSPVDQESRYETFVVSELIAEIGAKFRTRSDRAGRGIMGGSMGGHGACWIGIRHKDLFGVIGSVFGGLDLRPHKGKWGLDKVLGDRTAQSENWDAYSVVNLAPQLKNGEVELICVVGTEDFFLEHNRKFHEILSKNSVAHEYVEVCGPDHLHSCHSDEFFDMVEPMVFRFLARYFGRHEVARTVSRSDANWRTDD